LQEIRINSSCRYYEDHLPSKTYHPMHVLDEVIENINMWVKELPVNQEESS